MASHLRLVIAALLASSDGGTAANAGLPAAVLTFEPHPREFFAPEAAPSRLSTLREKLELLADDGVDLAHVCHFNAASPP
jgi:riboflavin kinase/FMN adenylyltransferase